MEINEEFIHAKDEKWTLILLEEIYVHACVCVCVCGCNRLQPWTLLINITIQPQTYLPWGTDHVSKYCNN